MSLPNSVSPRAIGLCLALAWLLAFTVYPAGAQQPAPDLEVRIERDTGAQASFTELGVYHQVTLIDRATGKPPTGGYQVFGQAANPSGGEQTTANECEEMYLNDPRIPPRAYRCHLSADHGGA